MSINYVRFQRGYRAAYEALKEAGSLDQNTLYFIYPDDNHAVGELYLGSRLISGGDVTVASASLNDLSDVILSETGANSFLVQNANGNWESKSLEDVAALLQLNNAAAPAQVFQATLAEGEDDLAAITRVVGETTLAIGDIAIVKALIVDGKYQHTAYVYSNEGWMAMDGNYSAANILTPEDIQVTTNVGELTANTIVNAGTNVADLLIKILSKSKNPTKINPKITAFNVTDADGNSEFEAGTSIVPEWASTFSAGSYTYKSSASNEDIVPVSGTGVSVNSWVITQNGNVIGSTEDGIGTALVLGDGSVEFKAVVNYSEGNYALTNLNKLPETEVRIAAGSAEKTATITTYRKMFAGGTTESEVNSALIRSLEISDKASTDGFEFKANVGDTKLIFAYPASLTAAEPKFEYFTMAWEPVGGFVKGDDIQVADARGGENGLMAYTVYTYTPAAAYAADTRYKVSF